MRGREASNAYEPEKSGKEIQKFGNKLSSFALAVSARQKEKPPDLVAFYFLYFILCLIPFILLLFERLFQIRVKREERRVAVSACADGF